MIRINLAKATTVAPNAATGGIDFGGGAAPTASSGPSNMGVTGKVIIILIAPLLLFTWEKYNIMGKNSRNAVVQEKLADLNRQIDEKGAAVRVVEELNREREALKKQMDVIGRISSKRAFKIQTLVEMQQAIPDDTWLDEVSITKANVVFSGFSRNASSVQVMVDKLKGLEFLASVADEGVQRQKVGKFDAYKFKINATVKN